MSTPLSAAAAATIAPRCSGVVERHLTPSQCPDMQLGILLKRKKENRNSTQFPSRLALKGWGIGMMGNAIVHPSGNQNHDEFRLLVLVAHLLQR